MGHIPLCHTGWSKYLSAPDDYNTESRLTETFWSPCILKTGERYIISRNTTYIVITLHLLFVLYNGLMMDWVQSEKCCQTYETQRKLCFYWWFAFSFIFRFSCSYPLIKGPVTCVAVIFPLQENKGRSLRPFAWCDCGFESYREHGCVSCDCCVL